MSEPTVGETLVQIRIGMGVLSEKMDQLKDVHVEVKTVGAEAKEALSRSKVSENRIKDIEDTQKWVWRTIAGALIVGSIGIIFTYIKTVGG